MSEISIPLSSGNFWPPVVQFDFKEIKLVNFKSPPQWPLEFQIALVKSIYLVRNDYEEGV